MAKHAHVLDVYGTQLHLATTKREWKKLAKRIDLDATRPDSAGQVTTLIHIRKRNVSQLVLVIWISKRQHANADPRELVDTCAHEASHAAGRILEHIGHEVPSTDEPHAYLVGWLTGWLWERASGVVEQ